MTVLFVVLAWLLVVLAIVILVWKAGRRAPADFEREMALAELEDLVSQPRSSSGKASGFPNGRAQGSPSGETVCPPVRTEPSHSEGGRGDSRRSVAHGPSPLDLPRLGE